MEDHREKFKSFKRNATPLDEFFFSTCAVRENYKELASVIEIILVLSHGQSAVERNFSLDKSIIVDNISETSITNKKVIKDHMLSNKLSPATIHITKDMHTAYKSARVKYSQYLEEKQG